MYYLKCKNCDRLNEVKSKSLIFCSNCNKKLENNYSEWIKRNPEKTFDDFLQLICVSENEIPKNEEVNKPKFKYALFIIGKLILLAVGIYILYKTIYKSVYDPQHTVSFGQWLGSISFFLFAVEELLVDILSFLRKENMFRHMPALFHFESKKISLRKKRLMELSRFGVVWRSITLFIVLCICTSLIQNTYMKAAERFSYGDYDSAIFLLIALIGVLLMIIGVLVLYYDLYKTRYNKK